MVAGSATTYVVLCWGDSRFLRFGFLEIANADFMTANPFIFSRCKFFLYRMARPGGCLVCKCRCPPRPPPSGQFLTHLAKGTKKEFEFIRSRMRRKKYNQGEGRGGGGGGVIEMLMF